ncbi:MAG: DUF354 domain-containing protein [Bacteroidales bacterium]|nr:DUF354 domain-containing protein [Bacteroidales bacterium]
MKILIDIGHPAHVHLFRHLAQELIKNNNEVLFTCREKEFEVELLDYFGFKFKTFGRKYKSSAGKAWGLLKFTLKEYLAGLQFKPDLFISHGSIYAAFAAFLLKRPHIALEDSGNMEQIRFYRPFTKAIITPDVLPEDLGEKQIKYKAYHEIAYLHPNYYNPDDTIYDLLKINKDEKYCIVRFVSWNATHDEGQKGFSDDEKKHIVSLLSKKMRVFISSEFELTDELKPYKILMPPERMHDALYFASIVVGEGATMASEAGVLGTTAVYVNTIRRSYCEDQERFGLVYNFQDAKKAIAKIEALIANNANLEKQEKSKKLLLEEKIDLTAFIVWFVENWPESFRIMKEDPGYQERFR